MSGNIDKFVQKARTCLHSSRVLLDNHDCQGSISQSYYAMFHSARALLSADGATFKKHSGVIAAFGERYAKTGKINVELHRQLIKAFDLRLLSDYDIDIEFSEDVAAEQLRVATEFVDTIYGMLRAG